MFYSTKLIYFLLRSPISASKTQILSVVVFKYVIWALIGIGFASTLTGFASAECFIGFGSEFFFD